MVLFDFQTPVDRHKFYFQYITTPTDDTPGTTLVLHFDNRRYFFGRIGEGTQRACTERGVSIKKARNIFLTGETKWETNGGLLGMILTMSDVIAAATAEEKESLGHIRIHGGPKIWHSIACARRFIFRTGMPLRVFEASPTAWEISKQPDFYDDNVLIWALPIEKSPQQPPVYLTNGHNADSTTLQEAQSLRQKTVHDMFDSDWQKDRLYESSFQDVNLPAMVWIRDVATKDLQATFCHKMSDAPHISPAQKVLVRLPWPAALVTELPPADNLPSSVAMSYFVKGKPQRGAFNAKKANEAGVKPGPVYGMLASGQSVTLDGGKIVKPEDVMDPIVPGYGMAVLDVPHTDYMPDLLHKLNEMRDAGVLVDVHAFLWTLGSGVLASQAFMDFTAQFTDVKHVVSSLDSNSNHLAMDGAAASSTRLACIRPETFVVPRHDNNLNQSVLDGRGLIQAKRGLILDVAPSFAIKDNEVPANLDTSEIGKGLSISTKKRIPKLRDLAQEDSENNSDVTITTLGTGSAVPSRYRNVSANLLHIPSLGYFILDAGENTLGQLKRLYAPDELDDVLCNLHMIWISHLHADHHLGTVPLLIAHNHAIQRRAAAGTPVPHKLYLISERNMADYLQDYKSVESFDATLLRCLHSVITDLDGQPVNLSDTTMPISKLDTTRVSHCHGAQAISVTFSNGFKISYSGDCRPSASFTQIGQHSDVLIHEATFDDGMEGDAKAKRHCTIGEALGVAKTMKAKNVILTHFSQRYQKLPTLTDVKFADDLDFEEGDDATDPTDMAQEGAIMDINGETDMSASASQGQQRRQNGPAVPSLRKETSLEVAAQETPICIAFDLMRVTIPQIKNMYKYYPAIEEMFSIEAQKSNAVRGERRAANEAMIEERNRKTEEKRKQGEAKRADKQKKPRANKREDATQSKPKDANGPNVKPDATSSEPISVSSITTSPSVRKRKKPRSQSLPQDAANEEKKQKLETEAV